MSRSGRRYREERAARLGRVRCPRGKSGMSKGDALALIERANADGAPHRAKKPIAAYECPACGAWHVTSLHQRDQRGTS